MNHDNAGVHVPPPLLFVAGFAFGLLLQRLIPLSGHGGKATDFVGWLLIVAGLALGSWGVVTFRRARTAIVPNRPASCLVTTGPYSLSRNPMYGALSFVHTGGGVLVNSAWPILLLPLVLWTLYRMVVRREEAYLSEKFGSEYEAYRLRVRRWL